MTSCYYNLGQPENAVETGQRALTMARALGDVALHIQAAYYLGLAYHLLGHYRQAVDLLESTVAALEGSLVHERFGLPYLPSVFSRTWLVWCLAELGAFDEGRAIGQDALQIAEASERPWDLLAALRGVGLRALGQGDIQVALPVFERCLDLCQTWEIAGWFAIIAAQLGYTYALAGRMGEALPLLEQALGQGSARPSVYHARLLGYLSEVYLLDGRPEDALPHAVSALESRTPARSEAFRPMPSVSLVTSLRSTNLATSRRPKPLTSRPWPWPRGSACARSRPTATGPGHPVCARPARAGSDCAVNGYRHVPCYGDDLLAAPDGGGLGAGGEIKQTCTTSHTQLQIAQF